MSEAENIRRLNNIKDTDIDTIEKTRERLFAFQLTQSDIEMAKREFESSLNLMDEIIKKQDAMFERNNSNSREEKEIVLKNLEDYLQSLQELDINPDYFRLRKQIGQSYNNANLDEELHISTHIRILEFILPNIINKYSYNSEKMSLVIMSVLKVILFDYRLISKFKTEKANLEIIKNINKIMDSIMNINKTGKLLDSINATMEQTDNVASATEELSASVTSILETIKNVSWNTNKLLEDISVGQQEIESSLNDIVILNQGFTKTKGNINDLVTDIRNITQIIEFIKTVSEQTTLLAINASIEASRAGENGKGFSVIADEIRMLSAKTTESVEDITKVIKNVEEDTRKVDKNTEELFEELKDKTKRAQKAISTLDDITRQTREVGHFTKNMSEILDEQFVSTQKVKNFLEDVIKNSNEVKKLAETTGESIYEVSKEVEELRMNTIHLIPDLRHRHFLNIVKTEEKMQQWWIYNALLNYHSFPTDSEMEKNESRFWDWYSKAKNNPKISVLFPFKKLEEKHLELYHLEEKIRYLIQRDKKKEAKVLLEEIEHRTREISHLIDIIEKEI